MMFLHVIARVRYHKKGQIDKATSQIEFDNNNSKSGEYKVKVICDNMVYTRELFLKIKQNIIKIKIYYYN